MCWHRLEERVSRKSIPPWTTKAPFPPATAKAQIFYTTSKASIPPSTSSTLISPSITYHGQPTTKFSKVQRKRKFDKAFWILISNQNNIFIFLWYAFLFFFVFYFIKCYKVLRKIPENPPNMLRFAPFNTNFLKNLYIPTPLSINKLCH